MATLNLKVAVGLWLVSLSSCGGDPQLDTKAAFKEKYPDGVKFEKEIGQTEGGDTCGKFSAKGTNGNLIFYKPRGGKLLVGDDARKGYNSSCYAWERSDYLKFCKEFVTKIAKPQIDNVEKELDACMHAGGFKPV